MRIVRTVDFYKKIPNLEEKVLLDVGTGPYAAWSTAYFQALFEMGENPKKFAENVHAIDIETSFSIPEEEVQKHEDRDIPITFLHADAMALPFNNDSFDIVALGNILNLYLCNSEFEKIIEESRRVLRSNGYLIGKATLYGWIDQLKHRAFYGPRIIQIKKYETSIRKYFRFLDKGKTSFRGSKSPLHKAFYFLAKKR